jgi:hypothetical protein
MTTQVYPTLQFTDKNYHIECAFANSVITLTITDDDFNFWSGTITENSVNRNYEGKNVPTNRLIVEITTKFLYKLIRDHFTKNLVKLGVGMAFGYPNLPACADKSHSNVSLNIGFTSQIGLPAYYLQYNHPYVAKDELTISKMKIARLESTQKLENEKMRAEIAKLQGQVESLTKLLEEKTGK